MGRYIGLAVVCMGLGIGTSMMYGCSVTDRLSTRVSSGIDAYCTHLSTAERSVVRARVNAASAADGHYILVRCRDDDDQ